MRAYQSADASIRTECLNQVETGLSNAIGGTGRIYQHHSAMPGGPIEPHKTPKAAGAPRMHDDPVSVAPHFVPGKTNTGVLRVYGGAGPKRPLHRLCQD